MYNALGIGIGHVNECPTMLYLGDPINTQSIIVYKILTEFFWKFQKLHRIVVTLMSKYFDSYPVGKEIFERSQKYPKVMLIRLFKVIIVFHSNNLV